MISRPATGVPALALLAAKIILPNDPFTEQAALALMGGLDNQGVWTSTSDTGWALLALGEYFRGHKFADRAHGPYRAAAGRPAASTHPGSQGIPHSLPGSPDSPENPGDSSGDARQGHRALQSGINRPPHRYRRRGGHPRLSRSGSRSKIPTAPPRSRSATW